MEAEIIAGVVAVLCQGESLLCGLGDVDYRRRVPAVFNASIGGHFRHCLDHFQSALDALENGEIDYDSRKRDSRIENERDAALAEIHRMQEAFRGIRLEWLSRTERVRSQVKGGEGQSPVAYSTLGRELMFSTIHAIHHYAIIRVMCGLIDLEVPPGFGVAPSTLKHRAQESTL